ncbi:MAG: hypothetical protein JEZ12_20665 [Desulfobacterium sp.]|nr:hypothetical protein [Desulfobacterium sp.]
MEGKPFKAGGVINLSDGEGIKDYPISGLPQDKLFIIEFVGINAFAQPGQTLFIALQVHTNSVQGTYPIVPIGTSPYSDPDFPVRMFGSQRILLYPDPGSDIILTVGRNNDHKDARVFVDLSGRITIPLYRADAQVL